MCVLLPLGAICFAGSTLQGSERGTGASGDGYTSSGSRDGGLA